MSNDRPIHDYEISDHARLEMNRRGISEAQVAMVLRSPGQIEWIRPERGIYQAKIGVGEPPIIFLFRVFVDVDRYPPVVVTVYRTSKLAKYWRNET